MGIGPDDYGPPLVDYGKAFSRIGDSFNEGQIAGKKDRLEEARKTTLSAFAAKAKETGGSIDLKGVGTALLEIGDLEGGTAAIKMAEALADRRFDNLIKTEQVKLQREGLGIQREA